MKIDGVCHCGQIGFEAEIDPNRVIICHCTDCQSISGAPYRANVPVKPENFRMRGEPKIYVKTADSGNRLKTAFCGTCGSAIYSAKEIDPPHLNLRLGCATQRAELVPKSQGWCNSAMPWAFDITQIPKIAGNPHAGKK